MSLSAEEQARAEAAFYRGIRAAIAWLHERAAAMNDPHAKAVLNTAGFLLGVEKPDPALTEYRADPSQVTGAEEIAELIFSKLKMFDALGQICIDGDSIKDAARAVLAKLSQPQVMGDLARVTAERDEALDRIEELERDAEIVSVEFEKDCWRAVRGLLKKVGWTDFSEGITADLACEIIWDAIREKEAELSRLKSDSRAGKGDGQE